MNPDACNFPAYCNECKQQRSVAASRIEIQSGNPVKVYAIACDHSWTLSVKDLKTLPSALRASTS